MALQQRSADEDSRGEIKKKQSPRSEAGAAKCCDDDDQEIAKLLQALMVNSYTNFGGNWFWFRSCVAIDGAKIGDAFFFNFHVGCSVFAYVLLELSLLSHIGDDMKSERMDGI